MSNSRSEGTDPLRPSDHVDSTDEVVQPTLGFVGWIRWAWRQLTSMRTALVLLLLLAIAAIPGSLFPQRSADPNGVTQWKTDNPDAYAIVDSLQLFDVYTSPWFSAIYLLLFISLIGCIIPRIRQHAKALRTRPPRTPVRLARLEAYLERTVSGEEAEEVVARASTHLSSARYRVERYDGRGAFSVSAERGYLRETGNLVFHIGLVGILVAIGVGSGFAYTGQAVVIEGRAFVNTLLDYASMNRGRFVNEDALPPYKMTLDQFDVYYQPPNSSSPGQAGDFVANMTIAKPDGSSYRDEIRVNEPIRVDGDSVYLLGNGYAPTITVRDKEGTVVFKESVPFLPQDSFMTSLGVVKVADGLPEQLGLVGFFYPTTGKLASGALASSFPDLIFPTLTLDVYSGDLGIDDGTPRNVYALDTDGMEKLTGRNADSGAASLELMPGDTVDLPQGWGTVTFENESSPAAVEAGDYSKSVKRFVSLQTHRDDSAVWVLVFALLSLGGLMTAFYVPRRRVWVKATPVEGGARIEFAGLARGEDPQLLPAVEKIADAIAPMGPDGADEKAPVSS